MILISEWVTIISNALVAIAAMAGIAGLWQWRKELVGKSKFEIATKMTLLALQFRDEFKFARGMATFQGEAKDREKRENELHEESHLLDEQYARFKRVQKVQSTLQKLAQVGWEAEVLLREQDAKLVEPFENLFKQLYIATGIYFSEQQRLSQSQNNLVQSMAERLDNYHKVIYARSDDDEISKMVDKAVNDLKKQLKRYIQ